MPTCKKCEVKKYRKMASCVVNNAIFVKPVTTASSAVMSG